MVCLTSETQKSALRPSLSFKSINAKILELKKSMYEENRRKCRDEALVEKQLEELSELLASLESFSEK
jgi:hypothetical protein